MLSPFWYLQTMVYCRDKVLPRVLYIMHAVGIFPFRVGPPLAFPTVAGQLDPPQVLAVGYGEQPVRMDGSVVVGQMNPS